MNGDMIGLFFMGVMVGRFWFYIAGIFELTRRPTIHEEAEYITRNPDKFLQKGPQ